MSEGDESLPWRLLARAAIGVMKALAAYGRTVYSLPVPVPVPADGDGDGDGDAVTVPDDLSELEERWPEAWVDD
ncbi:hypothetical protein [Microtetraspora glauca]|uniref:Uncharacterized protein n=1 Tax=Microtetraspora glauca TaxID=1996 RepID=A0ABV3G897_MICGL